jgi:CRISPR/Cas system CSM-associated protein Csm3 (group 7 of RAMP superfamily)
MMRGATYNELRLDFTLIPVTPTSIQADKTGRFVRGTHPYVGDESIYIPGATLRGTLRHAGMQVLQGAGVNFCTRSTPCKPDALCPLCDLFGSPVIRGGLAITDAFPLDPIDSLTPRDSDPKRRPVPRETVQNEGFYGTLSLRNFQRWQVGLLALMAARLNIADIQIGGGRSLGMGQVTLRFRSMTAFYFGTDFDPETTELLRTYLHGAGELAGDGKGFAFPDTAEMPDLPDETIAQAGAGYLAVMLALDDPEMSHDLIDLVLTTQAIAWGNYLRQNA